MRKQPKLNCFHPVRFPLLELHTAQTLPNTPRQLSPLGRTGRTR